MSDGILRTTDEADVRQKELQDFWQSSGFSQSSICVARL